MQEATTEPSGDDEAGSVDRKGQRTRRRIMTAARAVFAAKGYDRATIRAIAAAAEVDKSSVIQYFGSKEQLFREAVAWTIPTDRIATDDPKQTADNMARGMLAAWAAEPNSPMVVLLRASMTSELAAQVLRTNVTTQAIDSIASRIDAPDARLRAAVAGAMLMGIASQLYILHMPDLSAAEIDDILKLVSPLVRELIAPTASEVP
ncbi:TetR/AcrR family transcriptional regulator [Mycobacterium avium]|nr:TetR family transcriptional regulator [Mycobacterium avium]ETA90109.1 TetR family transcriptional regulator [Mycobacterium avium 05-4293]